MACAWLSDWAVTLIFPTIIYPPKLHPFVTTQPQCHVGIDTLRSFTVMLMIFVKNNTGDQIFSIP
ncbi:hypothetical protein [Hallella colorans]|uniref:hypothetical protein n=1 Tax=Hallella colorans TaxID=1703337 RepID=UPI0023F56C73|nr:hypothetical protein [Hallella colorans]